MRILPVLLLLLLFTTSVTAADEQSDDKLKAPAGWGGETITLPPGFARNMSLKGTEHIRFAPGMMKPESDSFFCYAFAFEVEKTPALTEQVLKTEFLKYYRGLCIAVMNGKEPELDPAKFTVKLKRAAANETAGSEGMVAWSGTLTWVEPFATKKVQKLNLEIRTRTGTKQNTIFACVSPQKTDAAIWKQLRKIRDDYLKQTMTR